MTLKQAIFNYLSTHPGLTALIGTHIYPGPLPQRQDANIMPAVTYSKVSGVRIRTMGNTALGARPRFQFTVWAATAASADAIAVQLRAALDGYEGTMGGVGGVVVRGVLQENELDDYEPVLGAHQIALDFTFWHEGD